MRRIIQAALFAAVLGLSACGSTTPDSGRAPANPTVAAPAVAAPTAEAVVAPAIEPAAPAAPASTQAKPRFIDFYATW